MPPKKESAKVTLELRGSDPFKQKYGQLYADLTEKQLAERLDYTSESHARLQCVAKGTCRPKEHRMSLLRAMFDSEASVELRENSDNTFTLVATEVPGGQPVTNQQGTQLQGAQQEQRPTREEGAAQAGQVAGEATAANVPAEAAAASEAANDRSGGRRSALQAVRQAEAAVLAAQRALTDASEALNQAKHELSNEQEPRNEE